jgi:EamA-like transporter family protein
VNTLASLFCLPVLLAASAPELAQTNWGAVSGLAWLCLAFTALSFAPANMLWFAGVARVGTARASVYLNLQPFFGAVSALLLLSEQILTLQCAGGIVIVAGIALSRIRMTRPAAVEIAAPATHDEPPRLFRGMELPAQEPLGEVFKSEFGTGAVDRVRAGEAIAAEIASETAQEITNSFAPPYFLPLSLVPASELVTRSSGAIRKCSHL